MKKIAALMATALLTASVYAGEFADISIKDVKAAVDSKAVESKKAVFIDVNGADSYKAGHVPGALNWATVKKDLAAKLPTDKDALIVAYCGSPKCGAYAAAANAAKKLGYTNVKHMSAGIAGWKEAKMPTEAGK